MTDNTTFRVHYTKVKRLSSKYLHTSSGNIFGAWVEQIDGKLYPCVGYGRGNLHSPIECLYRGAVWDDEQTTSLYSLLMLNQIVTELNAVGSIEQPISIMDDERAKVLGATTEMINECKAVQS